MAFKKKEKSAAVDAAQTRLAAMKRIDEAKGRIIDYGDTDKPCSSATLGAKITAVEQDIETYNGLLAQADNLGNKIAGGEASLNEDTARVLLSAQGKFGRDSSEVEELGGTRQSERARPAPKEKPAAAK